MGLDDGFARGFGLMEGHIARQDAREFRQAQAAKADQQYQDSIDWRNKRAEVGDDRYQAGLTREQTRHNEAVAARDAEIKRQQGNWQQQFDSNQQVRTAQLGSYQSTRQLNDLKIQQAKKAVLQQGAVEALEGYKADGQVTDERMAAVKGAGIDPLVFGNPELMGHLGTVETVFKGGLDYNNPKSLQAFSALMGEQLQRGVGEVGPKGHKIVRKEVSRIVPGDGKQIPADHIALEVLVTDEQGNQWPAPLTVNRSTDPNDPVKSIPLDDVVSHLTGIKMLASDKRINQALVALGKQSGGKWASAGDGLIYNQSTGTSKQLPGYQPKPEYKTVQVGFDKEELWVTRDQGKTWQVAKPGEGQNAQPQQPMSWEQRVDRVVEVTGAPREVVEEKMRQDPKLAHLAPAQKKPHKPPENPVAGLSLSQREARDAEISVQQADKKKAEAARQKDRDNQAATLNTISSLVLQANNGAQPTTQQVSDARAKVEQLMDSKTVNQSVKDQAYKMYQRLIALTSRN